MPEPPAPSGRSRAFRILLGLAGLFVGLPLLAVVLFTVWASGVPGLDGETDRYRTALQVVVDDNGRDIRNTVIGECSHHRSSGWNTGTQRSAAHNGDEPFVVLSDRSLLKFGGLAQCVPTGGERNVYTFDAGQQQKFEGGRIPLPYSHAWHFDNVDDPKSIRVYLQQPLFRGGIDGIRVTDTRLSVAGRKIAEPMPYTGEDAFPWLKTIPWRPVGHQDYGKHLYLSTFSGFQVELYQLDERFRCQKFDREVDGPILVAGDVWDTCPPWSGENLGWLIAKPNADFSRIDYSYDRRSPHHIATLHRANWLQERGAPGMRDENDFYWQPQLCFDGYCQRTHAARRVVWEGFRLYYPKRNQVISVRWKSWPISEAFRRRDKPS